MPRFSPLAALGRAGDCMSFAIARYLAFAGGDYRPRPDAVMLQVATLPAELHLATLVRDGERWLVLDNRTLAIVDRSYPPIPAAARIR